MLDARLTAKTARTALRLGVLVSLVATISAAAQPSTDPGLRGSQRGDGGPRAPSTPAPDAPPPSAALAPTTSPLTAPPPAAPGAPAADQCRMACAQSYYFCLAGDAPETCPDAWSQCRLGCAAPVAPAR